MAKFTHKQLSNGFRCTLENFTINNTRQHETIRVKHKTTQVRRFYVMLCCGVTLGTSEFKKSFENASSLPGNEILPKDIAFTLYIFLMHSRIYFTVFMNLYSFVKSIVSVSFYLILVRLLYLLLVDFISFYRCF